MSLNIFGVNQANAGNVYGLSISKSPEKIQGLEESAQKTDIKDLGKTTEYTNTNGLSNTQVVGKGQGTNPFLTTSSYKPGIEAPKSSFAESMKEITEIAHTKAAGADVGLGGTNNPTETLGNRLMYSA